MLTYICAVGEAEARELAPGRGGGHEGGEQAWRDVGLVGQLDGAKVGALWGEGGEFLCGVFCG